MLEPLFRADADLSDFEEMSLSRLMMELFTIFTINFSIKALVFYSCHGVKDAYKCFGSL